MKRDRVHLKLAVPLGVVMAAMLTASTATVYGNTITVLNLSENGPSDLATSGNTPATFYSGTSAGGGFVLDGSDAFSQNSNVSPLGSNVTLETLSVFVANSGGEGMVGRTNVVGGELENIGSNQVYVAELLDSNSAGFGPAPSPGGLLEGSFVGTSFGGGGGLSAPGGTSVNGPNNPTPPTPLPEPAGLALVAAAALPLIARRRRRPCRK